jgi:hypothetical protein
MMAETPRLFRLNIEVGDIDAAAPFYAELLGIEGRPQAGARHYFGAGPVTLQVVQTGAPYPAAKAFYFAVEDLDAIHRRAEALGCLAADLVHGTPAGEPAVRPWGDVLSTRRTRGAIRSASWRKGRSTPGERLTG